MMSLFNESFDAARSALMKSQQQQKAYYDQKVTNMDYRVGDLVYVFSPVIKPGCTKKLTRRFHGPYRVLVVQIPKLLLRPYHKRHAKSNWTHVNRVKPCYLEHVPNFAQPSQKFHQQLSKSILMKSRKTKDYRKRNTMTIIQRQCHRQIMIFTKAKTARTDKSAKATIRKNQFRPFFKEAKSEGTYRKYQRCPSLSTIHVDICSDPKTKPRQIS